MNSIKNYFRKWDLARIIKLVIALALIMAYLSTKESLFITVSAFLLIQAVFNLSCPGGACATNVPQDSGKQVMKFEKYEPEKNKENV